MTRTEFLLARIADDEKNARSIENAEWFHGVDSDVEAEVLEFSNPARVLAECEAKRRIVEMCGPIADDLTLPSTHLARHVLVEFALPYASHADYREEWKP